MFPATTLSICTLLVALHGGGDVPDQKGPPAAPAAKGATAKAAERPDPLAEANRLKRSAAGQEGEAKHAALLAAAAEYEKVAKGAGEEGALVAEASFRAGELWRTLKREEEAQRCFERATAHVAAAPRVAARAWLELGHAQRRAKQFDAAERLYQRVLSIVPEQRRESAMALGWQGKSLLAKGELAQGHALLLAVGARYPEFRTDDIRHVDQVACDWIEANRREEARALVADCLARHAEPDEGDEEVDAAVRRALDKMKSRKLLLEPPAKQ
ncbi:MAG: tetratricopeptide repeat protein [Planctomycetes bacterium]|nr:tetratricopeptide repeat protein [Planctomycetota bacterium]